MTELKKEIVSIFVAMILAVVVVVGVSKYLDRAYQRDVRQLELELQRLYHEGIDTIKFGSEEHTLIKRRLRNEGVCRRKSHESYHNSVSRNNLPDIHRHD